MMEVPDTGKIVSSAYEQLRNAAEYAEEHLLLQRAIKRFCKRNLFLSRRRSGPLGPELVVELVQAGYLRNRSFSKASSVKLDLIIEAYMATFARLRQSRVERDTAMDWVLAVMSSEIENMLNPHHTQAAMVFFTYHYFLQTISRDQFADLPKATSYEFCMYIATHQALLKSDIDTVRRELHVLYKQSSEDIAGFKRLNQQIDEFYGNQLTQRLKRVIGRYGAPFRVLKSLADDRSDVVEILSDKELFMDAYNRQINHEYQQVERRLNRGLLKSIAFIFLTKILVGVAIEVPYDLLARGTVAFLPLGVNLLFPPVYMGSLKLGLKLPTASNAQTVGNAMATILYGSDSSQIQVPPQRVSSLSAKLIYSLLFAVPIAITALILQRIDFSVVQMVIFFVFFSTASFLGFRLSSLTRELELASRQTGLLASMRDFFYLPFIVFGQWLSRKYSKINAVGRFLDVAIELPLKTVLRLLRQWIRFLNEKHEELY